MTSPAAKVFVLDDDDSFVRSTVRLLGSWDIAAVGFTSPSAFLAHDPGPGPACLLVDLRMPGMSGLEIQRALAATPRRLPVVFVSGHADVQSGVEAMKAGAVDFLPKPVDERHLLAAVDRALAADVRAQDGQRSTREARAHLALLGPRERQVCDLVVTGKRDEQIAEELGWTTGTVRELRSRVMEVLSVTSLVDLLRALEAAKGD
jgi:FixJ family two-component response regulator